METQIADTLEQIRDRLAGFEVYRHIYNDNHELDRQLQYKIVRAYESFIGFCIVSTKYYTMGSLSERALLPPRYVWLPRLLTSCRTMVESCHEWIDGCSGGGI